MKKIAVLLFYFSHSYFVCSISAQNMDFENWVSLSSENDFLGLTVTSDRYYSYGECLDFLKRLNEDSSTYKLINVRLRLEGHTPKYKGRVEEEKYRRPFFGWLHSEIFLLNSNEKHFYKYGVVLGITGPSAHAGDYQNWYHRELIDDRFVLGWENQTPNRFGLNFQFDYKYTLYRKAKHNLRVGSNQSLGNLFTFISPTINYQFNTTRRNVYLPYNYATSKKGNFTFEMNLGFTYEFYNATLQGEFFDNGEYLSDDVIYKTILIGDVGLRYSIKKFTVYLNNSFNSRRVKRNDYHNTGRFGIGYQW